MKPQTALIDRRPFRSKADHETALDLESKYRQLGIPEVVSALHARQATVERREGKAA